MNKINIQTDFEKFVLTISKEATQITHVLDLDQVLKLKDDLDKTIGFYYEINKNKLDK